VPPPRACAPTHCATCGPSSPTRWSGPRAGSRTALEAGLLDLPLPGRGATGERFAAWPTSAAPTSTWPGSPRLTWTRSRSGRPGGRRPGRRTVGGLGGQPTGDPLLARRSDGGWRLDGTKPWCSGAGCCDRRLVTARDRRRVPAVRRRPGRPSRDRRRRHLAAAAMQGSDSGRCGSTGLPPTLSAVRRSTWSGRLLARGGRRGRRCGGAGRARSGGHWRGPMAAGRWARTRWPMPARSTPP
jgi:hypothetical protein